MSTVLIIISLIILISYTVSVLVKNNWKIPSSISATFYSLEHKFWFGFSMIVSSFILLPGILEITPEKYQSISFLACLGMVLIGSAPNFKWCEVQRMIHATGAVMVLLFSQILVSIINPWFLLPWIPYIICSIIGTERNWDGDFISSYDKTNPLFWIEVVAIICTYGCLLVES